MPLAARGGREPKKVTPAAKGWGQLCLPGDPKRHSDNHKSDETLKMFNQIRPLGVETCGQQTAPGVGIARPGPPTTAGLRGGSIPAAVYLITY
jgi:hypothetical protein